MKKVKKKIIKKKPTKQVGQQYKAALVIVLVIMIATITYKWFYVHHMQAPMMPNATGMQSESGFPVDASLSFQKENSAVAVIVDTGADSISGVQLAISYDPKILSNVTVTSGSFLTDPIELQNSVDASTGTINYTTAIQPNGQSAKGQGTVAIISYNKISNSPTRITITPMSKITSLGANISVLKSFESITLP